jgi:hypothetical protein
MDNRDVTVLYAPPPGTEPFTLVQEQELNGSGSIGGGSNKRARTKHAQLAAEAESGSEMDCVYSKEAVVG